jgi:hypothetical protein
MLSLKDNAMKLATTIGLSFAALLLTVSAPFEFKYLNGLSIDTAKAVATVSLLNDQGELISGVSDEFDGPRLYNIHGFRGDAGQQVSIVLESQDFDTLLLLGDEEAKIIANSNDFNADTTNSRIDIVLPYTGVYGLVVTTYGLEEQGRYQLSVTVQ